jgi:endonuclease YncB( thermonuclease family)
MKTRHIAIIAGVAIGTALVLRSVFNPVAVSTARGQANDLPAKGTTIAGQASVHDGDTIRIVFNGKSHSLRIFGIDAPELDQKCTKGDAQLDCGITARDRLKAIIGQQRVECTIKDIDRYKRLVTICHVGGRDVAQQLVREGLVLEYKRYSGGMYAADEAYAQQRGLGLWSMQLETPSHYRACHSRDKSRPAPPDCQ